MLLWKKALLKKTMNFSVRNLSLLSIVKADPPLATRFMTLNMTWDRKARGKSALLVNEHDLLSHNLPEPKLFSLPGCQEKHQSNTKEQLRKFLDVKASIHADDLDELEWKTVLKEVSGGKA
ncbi:unnamed protein product [Penicillium bialowiezense]